MMRITELESEKDISTRVFEFEDEFEELFAAHSKSMGELETLRTKTLIEIMKELYSNEISVQDNAEL